MTQKKTAKNKRTIAVITGGRMTYGYSRPVIREIKKRPNLDHRIIVANQHLLPEFGYTVSDIEKDNFKIHARVRNTLAGYNRITMVKSLGVFMLQLPEILEQINPDIVLIAGDRGEHLVGAIVGAHMYIPVAHIQSGERSGNIDDSTRHAIARYAHIHLASNEDAEKRLLKMGEQKFRVYNTGAPQLDDLLKEVTPKKEVYKKYNLDSKKPIILFLQHTVTEEADEAYRQIQESVRALEEIGHQTICILNNSDASSAIIRDALEKSKVWGMQVFAHIKRSEYAGLMNVADVIVGNSSCGLLEAPSFRLPAVNIGNRQRDRFRGMNVIDVGYDHAEIVKGIRKALSSSFKKKMERCSNPYGDGKSAKRIADILEKIAIDDKLLVKKIVY